MPILSVIIPTHNRAHYAVPTIRSVLSASADIEVVVTDTSDEDLISPQLQTEPGWSRVRLVRPGEPLSVVDNFNVGLANATGDYLAFLGDDDFVTPKIIDLVQWARQQQVDAIQLTFPVLYYWPDFMHKRLGDHYAGTLQVESFSGDVRQHDALGALRDAARNLGGGVGAMPRAYAGIVSRGLVQQIIAKHGALFGGVSPDIYSAALISETSARCVHVDYPVIIPGSSGASTAGQSARGKHVGGLRENAHIGAFKQLMWDDLVPEFYSVPTVWSYSLLRALDRVTTPVAPNYGRLYARCFFYHRSFVRFTLSSLKAARARDGSARIAVMLVSGFAAEIAWIFGKVVGMIRARWRPATGSVIKGLPNTQAACGKIAQVLQASYPPLKLPTHLAPRSNLPI